MFKSEKRYITRKLNEILTFKVQMLLWEKIDSMQCKKDYLQVFNLLKLRDKNREIVLIEQYKEQPKKTYTYVIDIKLPADINELKIFVIDSEEYSTMMLAEEY